MYNQQDFESEDEMPVSRAQLVRELAKHGVPVEEYDAEHAVSETYDGREALQWLGY